MAKQTYRVNGIDIQPKVFNKIFSQIINYYTSVFVLDLDTDTVTTIKSTVFDGKPVVEGDISWSLEFNERHKTIVSDKYYPLVCNFTSKEFVEEHLKNDNDSEEIIYYAKDNHWRKGVLLPLSFHWKRLKKALLIFTAEADLTKEITEKERQRKELEQLKNIFLSTTAEAYADILTVNYDTGEVRKLELHNDSLIEVPFAESYHEYKERFLLSVLPDDLPEVKKALNTETIKSREKEDILRLIYRSNFFSDDGNYRWYYSIVKIYDKDGQKVGSVLTIDTTQEVMERRSLRDKVERDPFTYLHNQFRFQTDVREIYQDLSSCGVVLFTIKNLKELEKIYDEMAIRNIIFQFSVLLRIYEGFNMHIYKFDTNLFLLVYMNCEKTDLDNLTMIFKEKGRIYAESDKAMPYEVEIASCYKKEFNSIYEVIDEAQHNLLNQLDEEKDNLSD